MGQSEWKSSYDDDGDRFAGIKKILARVFGDGENPLAWGFPLFTISKVRYKIHLIMVVYLLAQLIFTLPGHKAGAVFVVPSLIAMVVLVLLHELAHAYVALRNGAQSDQRMLWMLGGLEPAQFDDPDPNAELRTALAGPALNLALVPVFMIPLVLLTGSWDAVVFNPFNPSASIHTLILSSDQTTPWWLVSIWGFHVVNLIILGANIIPMLPFDAGTVLRIHLSKNRGDLAARHLTALSGLWIATIVGLVGIIFADAKMLLGIAIISGIICTIERRRLQFLDYAQMIPGYQDTKPPTVPEPDDTKVHTKQDIDRILQKISTTGIDSLTRSERRTLKKATESSRNLE
ncbi:MAG: hypothetical protein P1U30_05090 [Phycisphaerales bacterium]|nr:hypothetical protein [Phycisphaerales bacterium]